MGHDHDEKKVERQHLGATTNIDKHASHGGLGIYMARVISLCVLTLLVVCRGQLASASREIAEGDVGLRDDGRFLCQSVAGDAVFHASQVGSQLEVCPHTVPASMMVLSRHDARAGCGPPDANLFQRPLATFGNAGGTQGRTSRRPRWSYA